MQSVIGGEIGLEEDVSTITLSLSFLHLPLMAGVKRGGWQPTEGGGGRREERWEEEGGEEKVARR